MFLSNLPRERTSRAAARHKRSRRAEQGPRPRHTCQLHLESLEDRLLLAGDTVLQWNEILMQTLLTPGAQPGSIPVSRSPAIMHAAIYDAVNAIDRSYTPYFAEV